MKLWLLAVLLLASLEGLHAGDYADLMEQVRQYHERMREQRALHAQLLRQRWQMMRALYGQTYSQEHQEQDYHRKFGSRWTQLADDERLHRDSEADSHERSAEKEEAQHYYYQHY